MFWRNAMKYLKSIHWKKQIELLVRDAAVIITTALWAKLVIEAWNAFVR